jgi:carbonic anhydrase
MSRDGITRFHMTVFFGLPICNKPVQWYLMKNPIEMSEAQIDQYRKYYHNTPRPLQSLNNRLVVESRRAMAS